jgi:hypothetical protein
MNKLLGLAMLATQLVAASAVAAPAKKVQVLATYAIDLPVKADEEGHNYGILTLKSDRSLTVQKVHYDFGAIGQSPETISVKKITVGKAVMDLILQRMLTSLSTAELKQTHQDVVCMMMPLAGPSRALKVRRDYDYETETFKGELVTVNDNTGCWSPFHTTLANEWEQTLADQLEITLNALALQLAAH